MVHDSPAPVLFYQSCEDTAPDRVEVLDGGRHFLYEKVAVIFPDCC
jgi:hypothetical protein